MDRKDIVQIAFRSTFFFKDSLEWNYFYKKLSNIEKIDKIKLISLAMLSIETLLKAITIIWLPIKMQEKWIKKYLKEDLNHWLYTTYSKFSRNVLSQEQENLLKKRDEYWVEIRYSIDALFKWLEIKWVQSNRRPKEKEEINKKIDKELKIYEDLYEKLKSIYEEKCIELDPETWKQLFDTMHTQRYSLWVSSEHHKIYKEEYFKPKLDK